MKQKLLLFFMLLLVLNLSSQTFDGEAGNLWNVPENWDTNSVPLPGSSVIIPDGFEVVANIALNIGSLDVQGTASLTTNNNLVFSNSCSIDQDATLNFNGGAISGLGMLPPLSNNGTINIYGIIQISSVNLTNNGIIDFQSGQQFSMNGDTVLMNNETGVVQFTTPGTTYISNSGGSSNIINNGMFRVVHQDISQTTSIEGQFENNNLLIVENSTLRFGGNFTTLNSGAFQILADGELLVDGTTNLSGSVIGILDGVINWNGFINLLGNSNLNFSGNGVINANVATLQGNGSLTTSFDININNSVFMLENSEWINQGDMTLTQDSFVSMAANTRLENAVTGVIDFVGNNTSFISTSTNTLFENFGLIKVTMSNPTDEGDIGCNFINQNSEILVDSGTLRIGRSGASVVTLNAGIYDIDPDGILNFGEVFINGNLLGEIDGDLNWLEDIYVTGQSNFKFTRDLGRIIFDGATVRGGGVLMNETGIDVLGNNLSNILDMTTLENEGDINFLEDGNIRIGVDCNLINRLNGMVYFEGDNSGIGRFGTGITTSKTMVKSLLLSKISMYELVQRPQILGL